MLDWKKMEEEYVSTQVSYRELGRRYGVSASAICRRGQREDWPGLRRLRLMGQVPPEPDREPGMDRRERYLAVSDRLLEQTEQVIRSQEHSPAALKTLSEVMKNIREIQMLRTRLDRQEQQARIDKMRKEVDREVFTGEQVVIRLEGTEEYAR